MTGAEEAARLEDYYALLERLVTNLPDLSPAPVLAEEERLRLALRAVAGIFGSDLIFIGRPGQRADELEVSAVHPLGFTFGSTLPCHKDTVWREVLDGKVDGGAWEGDEIDGDTRACGLRSAMAVPFLLPQGVDGLLVCCNKSACGPYPYQVYGSHELKILQAIANVVSLLAKRDRSLREDLKRAAAFQRSLLPTPGNAPLVDGFDVACRWEPAKNVGGDYCDFFPIDGHALGIVLGDVSGKGMGAAVVMVLMHSFIRSIADTAARGVEEMAARLHRMLARYLEEDRFVTMALCVLDASSERLVYCTAAHPMPLVYRKREGSFLDQPVQGTLAMWGGEGRDRVFQGRTVDLEGGDVVVLWTDGISEASAGGAGERSQFGVEGIKEVVRSSVHMEAGEIADSVLSEVRRFHGQHDLDDDASVIVIKAEEVKRRVLTQR